MASTPDGATLTSAQEAVPVEQVVWAAATTTEPPALIVYEVQDRRSAFTFSSLELGLATETGQGDLVRSTVWEVLRGLPQGVGVTVDPGHAAQVDVAAEEVERLLGGPQGQALPLSPAGCAGLAATWVLLVLDADGGLGMSAGPDGAPAVATWTDRAVAESLVPAGGRLVQAVLGEFLPQRPAGRDLVIDPGAPAQQYVDGRLAAAVVAAYGLWPAGHEVGLAPEGPPWEGAGAAVAAAVQGADGLKQVWVVRYQTRGGRPRLLVVPRFGWRTNDDARTAALGAINASLEPWNGIEDGFWLLDYRDVPTVRQAQLEDLPPLAL